MLRRVIVPFVELFFILLLVFIALYLVTAALTGEGETRAQDELHVLEVQLSLPEQTYFMWSRWLAAQGPRDNPVSLSNNSISLSNGVYRRLGFTLEAATLSSYARKEGWSFGWSSLGDGEWKAQDNLAVVLDGVCTPFTDEKAHLRNGEHRRITAAEGDLKAPSTALRIIATGGQDADFTALVDKDASNELQTTNVRVLFQPREIERQTILRFGVPAVPSIEGVTPVHESISFLHEVLGDTVRVNGAITIPRIAQYELSQIANDHFPAGWSGALQASAQVKIGSIGPDTSVPMIFSLPDCTAFPMIYLYALLGPSGVELFLTPPERGL